MKKLPNLVIVRDGEIVSLPPASLTPRELNSLCSPSESSIDPGSAEIASIELSRRERVLFLELEREQDSLS